MPAQAPGKTFSVPFTKASAHNHPAVELGHAGIAYKSAQPAPAVPSVANAAAAVLIAIGEEAVIHMEGTHTILASLLPAGAKAGDKLWINPADNTLSKLALPGEVNPQIKLTVSATGGTFTFTIDGAVSGAIAFNATAAALREALEAMPNIKPGDITVTGGPGDATGTKPYVITFVAGPYANGPKPAMSTQTGALEGTKTAVIADVVVGVAGAEGVKWGIVDELEPSVSPELAVVNLSQRSSF